MQYQTLLTAQAIDGTSTQVQEASRQAGELLGGAKINHIFRSQFYDSIQSIDACTGLSDGDIGRAIRQATGAFVATSAST